MPVEADHEKSNVLWAEAHGAHVGVRRGPIGRAARAEQLGVRLQLDVNL
jgi:hypothetical protein